MYRPFLLLFLLVFVLGAKLTAKQSETSSYRVPAGTAVERVIPVAERYLFPAFQKCVISYADGQTAWALANYNLLYQRMQLVTVKGDTVTVKLDYRIKEFDFGSSRFVNDYKLGLVEVGHDLTYPQLGKRLFFQAIEIDEGYHDGYSNQVNPSASYSVLKSGSALQKDLYESLSYRSNVLIKKQEIYFFVDKNNRIHQAKGQNIYEIMPRHRHEIKEFVVSESIDFSDEMALARLMFFCQNLESVNYVNKGR
jgi:hypothetical protein